MKLPSIIGMLILAAGLAQAAPDRAVAVKTTVNGMVCSFCARPRKVLSVKVAVFFSEGAGLRCRLFCFC